MTGSQVHINNRKFIQDFKNYSILDKNYELRGQLGAGQFGTTFSVIDKLRGFKPFALKKIRSKVKQSIQEAKLLLKLDNPCIITIYSCWEEQNALFLETDLGSLNLEELMANYHDIPEQLYWTILQDLSYALEECHNNLILHLDLKPSNVLLTKISTFREVTPRVLPAQPQPHSDRNSNVTPDCQNLNQLAMQTLSVRRFKNPPKTEVNQPDFELSDNFDIGLSGKRVQFDEDAPRSKIEQNKSGNQSQGFNFVRDLELENLKQEHHIANVESTFVTPNDKMVKESDKQLFLQHQQSPDVREQVQRSQFDALLQSNNSDNQGSLPQSGLGFQQHQDRPGFGQGSRFAEDPSRPTHVLAQSPQYIPFDQKTPEENSKQQRASPRLVQVDFDEETPKSKVQLQLTPQHFESPVQSRQLRILIPSRSSLQSSNGAFQNPSGNSLSNPHLQRIETAKYIRPLERLGSDIYRLQKDVVFQLIDFGLARETDQKGEAACGDSRYLQKEFMITGVPSYQSDVFSLGAMAFEILSAVEMPTNGEAYEKLRNGQIFETLPDGRFGKNLQDYIDGDELQFDEEFVCCQARYSREAWRSVVDLISGQLTIQQWRQKYALQLQHQQRQNSVYNHVDIFRQELFDIKDTDLTNRCIVLTKPQMKEFLIKKMMQGSKVSAKKKVIRRYLTQKHYRKISKIMLQKSMPDMKTAILKAGWFVKAQPASSIMKQTLRESVVMSGLHSASSQLVSSQQQQFQLSFNFDTNNDDGHLSPSYNCRLPSVNPNLILSGDAFNFNLNEEDLEKRFFLDREPSRTGPALSQLAKTVPEPNLEDSASDKARAEKDQTQQVAGQSGPQMINGLTSNSMTKEFSASDSTKVPGQRDHAIRKSILRYTDSKILEGTDSTKEQQHVNFENLEPLPSIGEIELVKVQSGQQQLTEYEREEENQFVLSTQVKAEDETSLEAEEEYKSSSELAIPQSLLSFFTNSISRLLQTFETITGLASMIYFQPSEYATPTRRRVRKSDICKGSELNAHPVYGRFRPVSGDYGRLYLSELQNNGYLTPRPQLLLESYENKRQNIVCCNRFNLYRPGIYFVFNLLLGPVTYVFKIMKQLRYQHIDIAADCFIGLLVLLLIFFSFLLYQLNRYNTLDSVVDPLFLKVLDTNLYIDPRKFARGLFGFVLPVVFLVIQYFYFWWYNGDVGLVYFMFIIIETLFLQVTLKLG